MPPQKIKSLREQARVSQAVFAAMLNTSIPTVQKWEIGDKKPSGPSLKLLDLIERKGLDALNRRGRRFLEQAPGGMTFGMYDQVEVGGCVWQHTAATCIGKGMIRNGFFAGIRQNRSQKGTRNQHVESLVDK